MNMQGPRLSFNVWKERTLRIVFILVALVLLGSSLFIVFSSSALTAPVILKFDSTRGITLFGEGANVWGIWFLGFCIIAVNTVFSEFFFFRERMISYVFLGTNVLIAALLFVIISVIVAVN